MVKGENQRRLQSKGKDEGGEWINKRKQ
ncbi:hypothetical protein C5167_027573 [Papaver somniferum]|nr:hypothetical protein C5167_027573 [Papaver somniferum]